MRDRTTRNCSHRSSGRRGCRRRGSALPRDFPPRYARVRTACARAHVRGAGARVAAAPAVGGRRKLDAGAGAQAVPVIARKRAAGLHAGGHGIDYGGGARVAAHPAVGGVRQVDALSAARGEPVRTAAVRGDRGGAVPRICGTGFNLIRGVQTPAAVVRATVVEGGEAALLPLCVSRRASDRFCSTLQRNPPPPRRRQTRRRPRDGKAPLSFVLRGPGRPWRLAN